MNLFSQTQNRLVKAPINPLDKSTVFSIYPKAISERKVTLDPGIFELLPGTYDFPSRLVVGASSWWKDASNGDGTQPPIEIPTSSVLIAESIVRDYCSGIHGCNMGDSMPGLFWLPGSITVDQLRKEHKATLETAKQKQINWFNELIRRGDILWARSNGNPLAIDDNMKIAAQELNVVRDWTKAYEHITMISCKACSTLVRNNVVVCPNCKVILNPEEFKKLGLAFAS